MKKLLAFLLLLVSAGANAQFTPGQLLTAAQLNSQFASKAPIPTGTCLGTSSALNYNLVGNVFSCNGSINALTLGGATFASPGPIGSVSTSTGSFSSISTPSATIGGGSIDATTVGATSPSTGKFTNLTYTGTFTSAAGTIALTGLATEAANTIVANATGSTASPTAISAPSCS